MDFVENPGLGIAMLVIVGIILVAVAVWWTRSLDRERIATYLTTKGAAVDSIKWKPFGAGWFDDRANAVYHVTYRDRKGAVHMAYCKTGIFTGVYFTDDTIVASLAPEDSQSSDGSLSPSPLSADTVAKRDAGASLQTEREKGLLLENIRLKTRVLRLEEEVARLRERSE